MQQAHLSVALQKIHQEATERKGRTPSDPPQTWILQAIFSPLCFGNVGPEAHRICFFGSKLPSQWIQLVRICTFLKDVLQDLKSIFI